MSNKGVTRGYKERRGNIYNPKLYTGDPADLLRIPSGSIAHLYDAFLLPQEAALSSLVEAPGDREDALVVVSDGAEGGGRKVDRGRAATGAGVGDGSLDGGAGGGVLDPDRLAAVGAAVNERVRQRDDVGRVGVNRAAGTGNAALGVESSLEAQERQSVPR